MRMATGVQLVDATSVGKLAAHEKELEGSYIGRFPYSFLRSKIHTEGATNRGDYLSTSNRHPSLFYLVPTCNDWQVLGIKYGPSRTLCTCRDAAVRYQQPTLH